MLHPAAIREFLNKPRDSFAWLKSLPDAEIDAALGKLKPPYVFASPTPLAIQQKVGLLIGAALPRFAFWYDMGCRKSRLALELLVRAAQQGKMRRGFILAKSDTTAHEWRKEIVKWKVPLPYIILGNSSSEEKWAKLRELDDGLVVITYGGLAAMCSAIEASKKKSKAGRGERTIKAKLVKQLSERLDAIVLDESTSIMNKQSLTFRAVSRIAKLCRIRYALAGRPIGRDAQAVWAQMYMVDEGASLGDTLGLFREAFFDKTPNQWGGSDYHLTADGEEEMARAMEHRSLTYSAEECGFDVPIDRQVVEIGMPKANKIYLDKAAAALKSAKGDWRETKNAFMRMRQISSGFLGVIDDETGARASLELPENPKLDWLIEQVEEIPLDRKWLVFHEFTWSGRKISDELSKRKIDHGWIHGGVKNVDKLLDSFDNDPLCRGLVINVKMGSYSLNLQRANYVFVYESPVGVIDREQMERRAWRFGQERIVFLRDPVVAGTMDQRILDFHAEGEDLFKALMRRPETFV